VRGTTAGVVLVVVFAVIVEFGLLDRSN
jgi:hypothetical protein